MAEDIDSYESACNFLYSFVDYERFGKWSYGEDNFNLDRVRRFFSLLNNPHKKGWFVHVAGTNGKGSVCAMVANTLSKSGLKTGLYTSPHLVTFRERIRVDGFMIPEEAVIKYVRFMKPFAGEALSFFDVWTGLALCYFAGCPVDSAVLEVGMGGRLDTTNVVVPKVSIITPVSMDHVGKLGNSLAEIASEKAGIIKEGVPVVSSPQSPVVTDILRSRAAELGCDFYLAGKDFGYSLKRMGNGITEIDYKGIRDDIEAIVIPLNGQMQAENASCSAAALEILKMNGVSLNADNIRHGIGTVKWPGRLQILRENPELIIDGACNVSGAERILEYVSEKKKQGNVITVIGMCSDKDAGGFLSVLAGTAGRFIFTKAHTPRAFDPADIADKAPAGIEKEICNDPFEAVEMALEKAGSDGMVIVTGSLYLVGDIISRNYRDSLEKI